MGRKEQIEQSAGAALERKRPFAIKFRVWDLSYPTGTPARLAGLFEVASDCAVSALALARFYTAVRVTGPAYTTTKDILGAADRQSLDLVVKPGSDDDGLPSPEELTKTLFEWAVNMPVRGRE